MNAQSRKQRYRTLVKEIRSGMEQFYYVGMRLQELKEHQEGGPLYLEGGYKTFEECCKEEFQIGLEYARKTIQAAQIRHELPTPTKCCSEWTEGSVRPLTRIETALREQENIPKGAETPAKIREKAIKFATKVAKKVVQAVTSAATKAEKDESAKPLKLTAGTVNKFVDEELGVTKPRREAKVEAPKIDLHRYLEQKIGTISGIREVLQDVPGESWTLLDESHPELAERLATACDELAELMRS